MVPLRSSVKAGFCHKTESFWVFSSDPSISVDLVTNARQDWASPVVADHGECVAHETSPPLLGILALFRHRFWRLPQQHEAFRVYPLICLHRKRSPLLHFPTAQVGLERDLHLADGAGLGSSASTCNMARQPAQARWVKMDSGGSTWWLQVGRSPSGSWGPVPCASGTTCMASSGLQECQRCDQLVEVGSVCRHWRHAAKLKRFQ